MKIEFALCLTLENCVIKQIHNDLDAASDSLGGVNYNWLGIFALRLTLPPRELVAMKCRNTLYEAV